MCCTDAGNGRSTPSSALAAKELWGQEALNRARQQFPGRKKGLVLQRGLEGIPEPDGFERTRGDNWVETQPVCF